MSYSNSPGAVANSGSAGPLPTRSAWPVCWQRACATSVRATSPCCSPNCSIELAKAPGSAVGKTDGRQHYIGTYATALEAARARRDFLQENTKGAALKDEEQADNEEEEEEKAGETLGSNVKKFSLLQIQALQTNFNNSLDRIGHATDQLYRGPYKQLVPQLKQREWLHSDARLRASLL